MNDHRVPVLASVVPLEFSARACQYTRVRPGRLTTVERAVPVLTHEVQEAPVVFQHTS